ncbi:gustatory receptor 5a for trehalose [Folsomia candida]|uniref:gustatory receptor 5a for trehalose n=1 Tax=Folsomia candida TaxID=158441 RepID=UPI000B8F0272|nr:gustatory receptor 5a for trehalose [Folsomia candida]
MISQVDITSDLGGPKSDVLGIVRVKPVIENHTRNDKPSLQDKLRYYLIFGRVIGILPIQGVFHRGSKLTFKRIRDERYFGEDTAFWEFLVDDHGRIYQVMQSFKEFLSPIIFATCAANMFWICLVVNQMEENLCILRLYNLLGCLRNLAEVLFILVPFLQAKDIFKFYAIWNFLHVVVRFFTMSLLAAKVSSDAHKFADILKQCPIEMYTPKVARFERQLQTERIALTGMSCFSVTKPLILSIIGVLVTFEIILLHATPRETVVMQMNNCSVTNT